jgi:hypothetical protein
LGAGTALITGGDPLSGGVGAVIGEAVAGAYRNGTFGNTPLDQNSPDYAERVEYGVKVAKIVTALCVGYAGGDIESAVTASENAARHNALMFVFDGTSPTLRAVDDGVPEEETPQDTPKRGRSLARAEHGKKASPRPPSLPPLPTLYTKTVAFIEEGVANIIQNLSDIHDASPVLTHATQTAMETVQEGQRFLDENPKTAMALDVLAQPLMARQAFQALELIDTGIDASRTAIRRFVREQTGDQALGQNVADAFYVGTFLGGSIKSIATGGARASANVARKVAQKSLQVAEKIPSVLRIKALSPVEQKLNALRVGALPNSKQTTCLLADRANKAPYDPRAMESLLHARYGPNAVTSSTLPSSNMPNVKLAGQTHPKTNIVFDQRGMPVFDDVARFDTRISMEIASIKLEKKHMRAATRNLRDEIQAGRVSPDLFTPNQLQDIRSGSATIEGLTWHHHQDVARLQLITREDHGMGHVGGMHLWFSGQ